MQFCICAVSRPFFHNLPPSYGHIGVQLCARQITRRESECRFTAFPQLHAKMNIDVEQFGTEITTDRKRWAKMHRRKN